jgi:hypothetical protein
LPAEKKEQVKSFVHTSLGLLGREKFMYQISHIFHVKNLGRNVQRLISRCDICQRVKHPNRMFEADSMSRMPKTTRILCAVDFYGNFPTGRRVIHYILVCSNVFTKCVKSYAVRAATDRTCPQKITKHYEADLTRPKSISGGNGTQFTSPVWKKQLADLAIEVKFSSVRRP